MFTTKIKGKDFRFNEICQLKKEFLFSLPKNHFKEKEFV